MGVHLGMDCSFCDGPMPDETPRYYLTLSTGGTEELSSRICEHCWGDYRRELT